MYDNFHNENHDPIYNTGHENYYIGSWFDQFEPFELVWQKFVKKSIVKATCADDIDGLGSISTIWHGPNFNLDRYHVCFFLIDCRSPLYWSWYWWPRKQFSKLFRTLLFVLIEWLLKSPAFYHLRQFSTINLDIRTDQSQFGPPVSGRSWWLGHLKYHMWSSGWHVCNLFYQATKRSTYNIHCLELLSDQKWWKYRKVEIPFDKQRGAAAWDFETWRWTNIMWLLQKYR